MRDLFWRTAYRVAYQLIKLYWAVAHPRTRGALVAVWRDGRLLLIKNSYTPFYSLPGGYVRPGEDPEHTARRELREEVGIDAGEGPLPLAMDVEFEWERKTDCPAIFRYEPAEPPVVEPDNREVVETMWADREQIRRMNVYPPIRWLVDGRPGAPEQQAD